MLNLLRRLGSSLFGVDIAGIYIVNFTAPLYFRSSDILFYYAFSLDSIATSTNLWNRFHFISDFSVSLSCSAVYVVFVRACSELVLQVSTSWISRHLSISTLAIFFSTMHFRLTASQLLPVLESFSFHFRFQRPSFMLNLLRRLYPGLFPFGIADIFIVNSSAPLYFHFCYILFYFALSLDSITAASSFGIVFISFPISTSLFHIKLAMSSWSELGSSLCNSVRNILLQYRVLQKKFHKNKAFTIIDGGHLRNVSLWSNDLKFKMAAILQ